MFYQKIWYYLLFEMFFFKLWFTVNYAKFVIIQEKVYDTMGMISQYKEWLVSDQRL